MNRITQGIKIAPNSGVTPRAFPPCRQKPLNQHMPVRRLRLKLTALVAVFITGSSLLFSSIAEAEQKIGVLLSGNNPAYQQLADALTDSLNKQSTGSISITRHQLNKGESTLPKAILQSDITVTLGTSAASAALKPLGKNKIVSTFTTKNATRKLLAKSQETNTSNRLIGSVYLDQPARRLLNLARLINPKTSTLGMLTGKLSSSRLDDFRAEAAEISLSINSQQLAPKDNPVKKLEVIMANSQAYIVLPDNAEFNRTTARWIIYLSYRHGIPVIGYSSRYVDAGALASVFSTPDQMGRHAAEIVLNQLKNSDSGHQFEHPKYYDIRLNNKVKRSLGFHHLDQNSLKQKLKALEEARTKPLRQDGTGANE